MKNMQNRYVGDIGDYFKYALIQALAPGHSVGIAWYLYPNESHNADGKHVSYLAQPTQWRHLDRELFDCLHEIVSRGDRAVRRIEQAGLFGDAIFSSKLLQCDLASFEEKKSWRRQWFIDTQACLQSSSLVFADPDNGLCEDEKYKASQTSFWKRQPLSEALALSAGRTAVLYHHNSRFPGGHEAEIAVWLTRLPPSTIALRWRAGTSRTFFVVNPTEEMRTVIPNFIQNWGPKAAIFN